MTTTDNILKDGKDKLSGPELEKAEELQSEGLCEIQKRQYIDCVDPDDEDYFQVIDPNCSDKSIFAILIKYSIVLNATAISTYLIRE